MKVTTRALGLLLTLLSSAAAAGDLEDRVVRLERILNSQSIGDLVIQMERLRQEVQQLRGEIEVQAYNLQNVEKRQRDLYLDVDQRLNAIQGTDSAGGSVGLVAPPGVVVDSAPPEVAPPPPERVVAVDPVREEAAYQEAFDLLKQRRYPESITAFQEFLARYPGGSYADNAQYWLGEANYVNRDFDVAEVEFQKVLDLYPQSPKLAGAMLKLGYIHYEKQQWTEARQILRRLMEQYPNSTEARLAAQRLEKMRQEGR